MCVNYKTVSPQQLKQHFKASLRTSAEWKDETWQDYAAPIIVGGKHERHALLGLYSMIPKKHIPAGMKRFSTTNARAETIATLPSYSQSWRNGQLCLVPMQEFYEPNYESGKAQRWRIGMADESPFAVAGLYRSWVEPDGITSHSFTQITINADAHPVMRRFHRPEDEKRSLVILPPEAYDEWLGCRDPDKAQSFLRNYPAEFIDTREVRKEVESKSSVSANFDLF